MEDVLISLLPIVIIVFVWIFIMLRFKKHFKNNKHNENQDEIISLLKEIRDELMQLNKKDVSK
jgi:large-conductance mechanosensitive channel